MPTSVVVNFIKGIVHYESLTVMESTEASLDDYLIPLSIFPPFCGITKQFRQKKDSEPSPRHPTPS